MRVMLTLLVLLAACTRDDVVSRAGGARAPIVASLVGPRLPARSVELELAIEPRLPAAAELVIELRLPRGTRLAAGAVRERLTMTRRVQRAYRLSVHASPADDVVVHLDARGSHFGYHARLPYRFGRSPLVPQGPALTDRPLTLHGRNFGRSVRAGH
jgi:hypothetical protein